MEIYCLKCKRHTETKDVERAITKNNRNMLKGKCLVCGSNKSKFISITGQGAITDKIIDTMPEMHMPGYNFLGPFTKLDKRLDKNNKPLPSSLPRNELDKIAMNHDICYGEHKKFKDKNKICDKAMLADLKTLNPQSVNEMISKKIAQGAIGLKYISGLGTK